jgi:hypothetical protein
MKKIFEYIKTIFVKLSESFTKDIPYLAGSNYPEKYFNQFFHQPRNKKHKEIYSSFNTKRVFIPQEDATKYLLPLIETKNIILNIYEKINYSSQEFNINNYDLDDLRYSVSILDVFKVLNFQFMDISDNVIHYVGNSDYKYTYQSFKEKSRDVKLLLTEQKYTEEYFTIKTIFNYMIDNMCKNEDIVNYTSVKKILIRWNFKDLKLK